MKKIILHLCFISLIFHVNTYITQEEKNEEAINNKYQPVFNYKLKKEDFPKFSIEKFEYPDSNIISKKSKFKLRAKYEGNLNQNDQEYYLDIIIENKNKKINEILSCQIEDIEQDKNYMNFICGIELEEGEFIEYQKIETLGFGSEILQKIQINKNEEFTVTLKEEEESYEEEGGEEQQGKDEKEEEKEGKQEDKEKESGKENEEEKEKGGNQEEKEKEKEGQQEEQEKEKEEEKEDEKGQQEEKEDEKGEKWCSLFFKQKKFNN